MKRLCGALLAAVLICELFSGINVKALEISDSSISSDGVIELRTESTSLNEGDEIKVDLYLHNVKVQAYMGWFYWNSSEFSLVNSVEENNFVANNFTDENGTQVSWQKWFEEDSDFEEYEVENCDKCYYLHLHGSIEDGYVLPEKGYIGSLYLKAERTMEEARIVLFCGAMYADDEEKTYGNNDEDSDWELISLKLTNQGQDEEDISFHAEDVEKRVGESFSVPLTLTANQGFNALGLTIKYDRDVFSYQSLEVSEAFKGKIDLDSVYEVPDSNEIRASFIADEDITGTGEIFEMIFKVNEDAQVGSQGEISMEVTQLTNLAEKELTSKGTKAILKVAAPAPVYMKGDVNGDGSVDVADVNAVINIMLGK